MGRSGFKHPYEAKRGKSRYVTDPLLNINCFVKRDDIAKHNIDAEKNLHV